MKSEKLYQKITKFIKSKGYKELNLSSVVDIKYIRDEKLKKYLFTFKDNKKNKTFALRPDLSLMSLIEFSKKMSDKKSKIYYSGESYRKNQKINSQIGFEIYNSNNLNDDLEVIKNSAKIFQKEIGKRGNINIGNIKLFEALIRQLDLPQRWKSRILYLRNNTKYLNEILNRLKTNQDLDEKNIELDKKLYLKMKKLNPNNIIANRKVKDILQRFEQKIYIQPRPANVKKTVQIIKSFLKIKCPIQKAPLILNNFFKKNKLNIKVSKEFFPVKKNKIDNLKVYFNSYELPVVEIYDDMLFSIKPIGSKKNKQSIVGGRFNSLSQSIGLRKINAVGAAINLTS